MEEQTLTTKTTATPPPENLPGVKSATKLTALDLNGIRLDSRHTLLTPDYLEQLLKEKD